MKNVKFTSSEFYSLDS